MRIVGKTSEWALIFFRFLFPFFFSEWALNLLSQEKREIPKTRNVDVDKDGIAESNPGVWALLSLC